MAAEKPFYHREWLIACALLLAILAPTLAMIGLGLFGPAPYLLDRGALADFKDRAVLRQQGATVEATRFSSYEEAGEAGNRYARSLATSGHVKTLNQHRFTREDNGHHELVIPIEELLVRVEGRDREHVDAVFGELPFVRENPDKNLMWNLTTQHTAAFFTGLGLYVVVLILAFSHWHSAAHTMAGDTAGGALSGSQLRQALLNLGGPEVPFEVAESSGGRLVARWKVADARWRELISRGSLQVDYTMTLALDERSDTVRVVQTTRMRRTSAGLLGMLGSLSWRRSVGFGYESAAGYGFIRTDEGLNPAQAYSYRFMPKEISLPIADLVINSGWRFKPVYTLFRPLGG